MWKYWVQAQQNFWCLLSRTVLPRLHDRNNSVFLIFWARPVLWEFPRYRRHISIDFERDWRENKTSRYHHWMDSSVHNSNVSLASSDQLIPRFFFSDLLTTSPEVVSVPLKFWAPILNVITMRNFWSAVQIFYACKWGSRHQKYFCRAMLTANGRIELLPSSPLNHLSTKVEH